MLIKTAWNTAKYVPPSQPAPKPPRPHGNFPGEVHYKRGELPALVYAALLDGDRYIKQLAERVDRSDEQVHNALAVLEKYGYAYRVVTKVGKGSPNQWFPVEKSYDS